MYNDKAAPTALIISRAMAEAMFPHGDALGQSIYTSGNKIQASPIIGIVDRLQAPWVGGSSWAANWVENSALEPYHYLAKSFYYLVRTQPGQLSDGDAARASRRCSRFIGRACSTRCRR